MFCETVLGEELLYMKPTITISNPSPRVVFVRVCRGIINSNLKAQNIVLSETVLWETVLAEGGLYMKNFSVARIALIKK